MNQQSFHPTQGDRKRRLDFRRFKSISWTLLFKYTGIFVSKIVVPSIVMPTVIEGAIP